MSDKPDGSWPDADPPSGLTLSEWAAWRKADDMDALAAVRALLEDFDAGHAILRARALARSTLH